MTGTVISSETVLKGLGRLRAEGALGFGAQEVVSTFVIHEGRSRRFEDVKRNGIWGFPEGFLNFSIDSMEYWLEDIRRESYVPGLGTWTSCRVYIYPDSEGRLEIFDDELIECDGQGQLTERRADASTLFRDLKAFPRTLENIPPWMWNVFRSEGLNPPLFNSSLQTVDWDNKRLPVREAGTDFSVAPVVIDPSLESGFLAKISKKVFGH